MQIVKLNFKDFRLFDQHTGTSIFSAKDFDWFVEGRKVDFTQYYNLIERFDRLITTGFKGYKQNGEKIDEDLRNKFFDDMTAEMAAIKPLFDVGQKIIEIKNSVQLIEVVQFKSTKKTKKKRAFFHRN